jgi:hypothetical protein
MQRKSIYSCFIDSLNSSKNFLGNIYNHQELKVVSLDTNKIEPLLIVSTGAMYFEKLIVDSPIILISGSSIEINNIITNQKIFILSDLRTTLKNIVGNSQNIVKYDNFQSKIDIIKKTEFAKYLNFKETILYGIQPNS